MTRDTKAETRAINTILWKDWDPIGCGVPKDEYESNVWPVYKLLIDGEPRDKVGAYLRRTADEMRAVSVPEDRWQAVADELMALTLANTEEKYR